MERNIYEPLSAFSDLSHVYWIGGPPDAGKSTVANLLAVKFGLQTYHHDPHERDHLARANPIFYPANALLAAKLATLSEADLLDWLWLSAPPAKMAASAHQTWAERIPLVCEDLAALPTAPPIIAEGPGFFPEVICPLLSEPWHAAWLLPTSAFKRASHERRGKSAWRHHTSNPAQGLANHLERDLLLIEFYRQELEQRNLPFIEIDGTVAPEAIAEQVARHFRLLNQSPGT